MAAAKVSSAASTANQVRPPSSPVSTTVRHTPEQAIDAQAHLMRDLLRQFASVPLALAAYNAGAGRVSACGCIPAIPETQAYVARILGLMGGAGEALGGLGVELVA